jgi:hypothetical protein
MSRRIGPNNFPDGKCRKCGMERNADGSDPCWGRIPGARFACCGHGDERSVYVCFDFGPILRWQSEIDSLLRLKLPVSLICRCDCGRKS